MNIYTDLDLIDKYIHSNFLLRPFLGRDDFNERFPDYCKEVGNIFKLSNLEKADCAVYPIMWAGAMNDKLRGFIKRCKGKKVVVMSIQDYPRHTGEKRGRINNKQVLLLRTSCYRSIGDKHALPAIREDLVAQAKKYKIDYGPIDKSIVPTVSFCGQIHNNAVRIKAVEALKKSKHIRSNFVIRSGFWANLTRKDLINRSDKFHKVRKDFINNILSSNYALCVRGQGNFSLRFYEALSLGRIPVLVNTDCVLPFEQHINWRNYIVVANVDNVNEAIMKFHSRFSNKQFRELQRKCRKLWLNWLSLEGFAKNLSKLI